MCSPGALPPVPRQQPMSSDTEYSLPPTETDAEQGTTEPDAEQGTIRVRPARTYAADEIDSAPAPAASLLPVIISVVAGLLVIGLLGAILLAPRSAPAAGAAAIAIASPNSGAAPNGTPQQALPRSGYLAPDFSLSRLTGGPQFQLSSYRGQKPVWVNFWATWCPPCRGEMPEMQKIWQEYKDQGIDIIGVDVQEDQAKVQDFVTSNGYSWNFILDSAGTVSRQYYVSGIPTHVFIGRDGVIKDLVISGLTHDKMVSEVKALLAP